MPEHGDINGTIDSRAFVHEPVLYFNSGEEDRAAFLLLKTKRITCRFRSPSAGTRTPLVVWGFREYRGLAEIEQFVSEYLQAQAA